MRNRSPTTDVFLSTQVNVKPSSFRWTPTRLILRRAYPRPALAPLQPHSLRSGNQLQPYFFLKHVFLLKANFFRVLRLYAVLLLLHRPPSRILYLLLMKLFLRSVFTYASPRTFLLRCVTNVTKLERLHRAASRAITGYL